MTSFSLNPKIYQHNSKLLAANKLVCKRIPAPPLTKAAQLNFANLPYTIACQKALLGSLQQNLRHP